MSVSLGKIKIQPQWSNSESSCLLSRELEFFYDMETGELVLPKKCTGHVFQKVCPWGDFHIVYHCSEYSIELRGYLSRLQKSITLSGYHLTTCGPLEFSETWRGRASSRGETLNSELLSRFYDSWWPAGAFYWL